MLEKSFERLYLQFRAIYYRRMVAEIGIRDGSLTATESYCVEIIHLLGRPTVTQFANYLNISIPNANYKIGRLAEKGYVNKVSSDADRRETHLEVTDKFLGYYGLNNADNAMLMQNIRKTFTEEEVRQLELVIERVLRLMEDQMVEFEAKG